MYKVGDMILYGRTGVCTVEGVEEKLLRGEKTPQLFYSLKPLYQNCSISTPVASKVFSRHIITRDEAEKLIAALPSLEAEPYHNRNLNQLREYYRAKIELYDCFELARLCISIYRKRVDAETQKRKLGAVDERFLKEAEDLLYGELAAVLEIERNQVQRYIHATLAK